MQMNGLKLSNSWTGYHVLLNPDYRAVILWRFVNRAIDEVENGRVSSILSNNKHHSCTFPVQGLGVDLNTNLRIIYSSATH